MSGEEIVRGSVVDFVIQYLAPDPEIAALHYEVVRFDGSHGRAHYHVFNRQGRKFEGDGCPII